MKLRPPITSTTTRVFCNLVLRTAQGARGIAKAATRQVTARNRRESGPFQAMSRNRLKTGVKRQRTLQVRAGKDMDAPPAANQGIESSCNELMMQKQVKHKRNVKRVSVRIRLL